MSVQTPLSNGRPYIHAEILIARDLASERSFQRFLDLAGPINWQKLDDLFWEEFLKEIIELKKDFLTARTLVSLSSSKSLSSKRRLQRQAALATCRPRSNRPLLTTMTEAHSYPQNASVVDPLSLLGVRSTQPAEQNELLSSVARADDPFDSLRSISSAAKVTSNTHSLSNRSLLDNIGVCHGNQYLTTVPPMATESPSGQPTLGDQIHEQLRPSLPSQQQMAPKESPQSTTPTLTRYSQNNGDFTSIPDLALPSSGSNGTRHFDILNLQENTGSSASGGSTDLQSIAHHSIHAAPIFGNSNFREQPHPAINEEITTTFPLIEECDTLVRGRKWVTAINHGQPLPLPTKHPTDSAIDGSSPYFSLLPANDNSSTAGNRCRQQQAETINPMAAHQGKSGYCYLCQRHFKRYRDFLRHQGAKHSGKKIVCKFCHKELAFRKDSLKRHLERACKGTPPSLVQALKEIMAAGNCGNSIDNTNSSISTTSFTSNNRSTHRRSATTSQIPNLD